MILLVCDAEVPIASSTAARVTQGNTSHTLAMLTVLHSYTPSLCSQNSGPMHHLPGSGLANFTPTLELLPCDRLC